MFPPYVIIEHPAIGVLMNMRVAQIHSVPRDGVGNSTDEDDGAVRVQVFDDADMGERIVHLAVSIEIPRVIEEYEIARADIGSLMENTMLTHMIVNEPDAIPLQSIELSPI